MREWLLGSWFWWLYTPWTAAFVMVIWLYLIGGLLADHNHKNGLDQ